MGNIPKRTNIFLQVWLQIIFDRFKYFWKMTWRWLSWIMSTYYVFMKVTNTNFIKGYIQSSILILNSLYVSYIIHQPPHPYPAWCGRTKRCMPLPSTYTTPIWAHICGGAALVQAATTGVSTFPRSSRVSNNSICWLGGIINNGYLADKW